MSDFKPVIKVIGVGGGGGNAISYMSLKDIENVVFIAANTDAQDLDKLSAVQEKVYLGKDITKGLGAGADPEVGRAAAECDKELICSFLSDTNMLFVSAGMGGGTGTGAAPVIAKYAKELGILVVAVVTKPFDFERSKRMEKAELGIAELEKYVDALIVIPNQKLKETLDPKLPLSEIFEKVDDVLSESIQGISDIITKPGIINIDFNDVQTIMKNSGRALIGTGTASGEDKANVAAANAIKCPLLEGTNLKQSKRVIVNVTLDVEGNLDDFEKVGEIVKEITSEDAEVIIGTSCDVSLNDEIKVTIVATDFINDEPIEKEEPIDVSNNRDLPSFIKNNRTKKEDPLESLIDQKNQNQEEVEPKQDLPKEEEKPKEKIHVPAFLRKKV